MKIMLLGGNTQEETGNFWENVAYLEKQPLETNIIVHGNTDCLAKVPTVKNIYQEEFSLKILQRENTLWEKKL